MKKLLLTALFTALSTAAAGGTLVFGANGDPVTLDTGNATDGISLTVQRQIFDTLVDFKDGSTELKPGLAESWKANKDATKWTFKLRKGVKFHDGSNFNADAVVFNMQRWWDPKHPQGFRDQGRTFEIVGYLLGGYKGDKDALIKNIVKVDDHTVRIDLNKPSSVLPDVLASSYFGISSPKAIKALGAKYGTPAGKAVGTGPFIYEKWVTGNNVTLKANKNYWGRKAKVDKLIIRGIKDPSQRLNELKAGTIDFTNDLTPDSLKSITSHKKITAVKRPSFNIGFLALNNQNKHLKKAKVREAISMAINKKAIVEAFWNGLGVTNASFLPPSLDWANSKNVPQDYKYDPKAAKQLLKDAGYPNGLTVDLWYMPVSRPYFPNPKDIAQAMAADLSSIGVKAKLRTEDWGKYLEDRKKSPGFDMYMIGWTGDYGHPDNFYAAYYGPESGKDIGWTPVELNKLLEKGRSTGDRKAMIDAYAKIHEITYKARYRLPIVHSQPLSAAQNYVKGWIPSPLGNESFATISVDGKKK